MKNVLLGFLVLTTLFLSCKKDKKTKSSPTPIGTWQVVQSQTTHELGHYGPYDPPVREIDSRETLTIDHQSDFTIIDVSTSSLTWTEFDTAPVIHTWTQTDDLFSLTTSDTTLVYRIIELTDETFEFFIKDFRTYDDSTVNVAYEEFEYTYLLEKL
tara:strand:- start:164 stop:631 length:468 start_codon:yes stop_codon:yes gene_type:complete